MGSIRILDDRLANQIAAGEVVERPSSVVKELVENAIDAGSRTIDVTVEEGGIKSIRVTDDGEGMDAEDLKTAFSRHATSKIRTGKDLFAIRSLGFRGEALPSIAAVSRVECVSRRSESGLAHRIVLEGGTQTVFEETAAQKGTDFRIKDLFYNTPARLKYMKTVQTELSHITDYMYRLALSKPEIAFRLKHNDTQLLDTAGGADLLQAIAAVYGTATAKRMIPVQAETPDFRIRGWLARPDITRSNRSGITVVVNGRFVRNFQTAQAVISGYHTLLPINRFPLAVLHLEMAPELVDVNVHPAKLEVRFSKEAELCEAITGAVREALRKETLIPSGVSTRSPQDRVMRPAPPQAVQEELRLYQTRAPAAPPSQSSNARQGEGGWAAPAPRWSPADSERFLKAVAPSPAKDDAPPAESVQLQAAEPPELDEPEDIRFPKLFPIGQLLGTYIVAQNEDGMFLVDQHAAHERINYEYYYEKFGSVEPNSQMLLVPHTIEFTASEAELIRSRMPLLEAVGVYLEPFGGNTFKVRAHPEWFPKGEEISIIEEMAQWVLTEKHPDIATIREASATMCSCKASIKANQAQTLVALETLLERLGSCSNPFTCPHGRPIVVSFTKRDLEKMFKRVM